MKKDHDNQLYNSGRNIAKAKMEEIDISDKNYSTNPKSENSVPKKSSDNKIDDKNYASDYGGNPLKDDKSATDSRKYKMYDYGSTGKRNHKNKVSDS